MRKSGSILLTCSRQKISDEKKLFFIYLVFSFNSLAYITNDSDDPNIKVVRRDGSYSTSTGRGTCSHHGGVDHYL